MVQLQNQIYEHNLWARKGGRNGEAVGKSFWLSCKDWSSYGTTFQHVTLWLTTRWHNRMRKEGLFKFLKP